MYRLEGRRDRAEVARLPAGAAHGGTAGLLRAPHVSLLPFAKHLRDAREDRRTRAGITCIECGRQKPYGTGDTLSHTTHSTPASDRPATAHMTLTAHAHSTIHANSWPMTHASMQRGYPSAAISLHAIGASLHRVSSSHASASRTVRERAILSSASAESSSCGSAASLQRVSAAELWTKLIDSSVS